MEEFRRLTLTCAWYLHRSKQQRTNIAQTSTQTTTTKPQPTSRAETHNNGRQTRTIQASRAQSKQTDTDTDGQQTIKLPIAHTPTPWANCSGGRPETTGSACMGIFEVMASGGCNMQHGNAKSDREPTLYRGARHPQSNLQMVY